MMKKILCILLIVLAGSLSAQKVGWEAGGGGGASISQMMAVVADSSRLTAGSHTNALKPRYGKSLQGDSMFVNRLFGLGNPNTGIHFPGSDVIAIIVNGTEVARWTKNGFAQGTTTPMAPLHISKGGMSAVNYYSGLRLGNPDAATAGVQAFPPIIVIKASGFATTPAQSDSILFAIAAEPIQGAAAPSGRLNFRSKVGTGPWTNTGYFSASGFLFLSSLISDLIQSNNLYPTSNVDLSILTRSGGSNNIIFKTIGTTPTETARFTSTGCLAIQTTTPGLWELYVNGDAYVEDSLSVGTVVDRCEWFVGSALPKIASISGAGTLKNDWQKLNHATLPAGVKANLTLPRWKEIATGAVKEKGYEPPALKVIDSTRVVEYEDVVDRVDPKTGQVTMKKDSVVTYTPIYEPAKYAETAVKEDGRDLGAMVSLLTKGIQELIAENAKLVERIQKLEKPN